MVEPVNSFAALAPALKKQGYCVYGGNIRASDAIIGRFPGVYLSGPVKDSAQQLGQEVDKGLTATGAEKVDLVGWSQGGIVARGYLKFLRWRERLHPGGQQGRQRHHVWRIGPRHHTVRTRHSGKGLRPQPGSSQHPATGRRGPGDRLGT